METDRKLETVLIIDDDYICNFLMTKVLQRFSKVKVIHTAESGMEAIALIKDFHNRSKPLPGIIFLDINMPVMDGFAFLGEFTKLGLPVTGNIRIVIVSSSDNPLDLIKARQFGITDYLIKPVSVDKLTPLLS
jgi:response regulator of citrate/malate metabolism